MTDTTKEDSTVQQTTTAQANGTASAPIVRVETERAALLAFEPRDMTELERTCKIFFESRLLPKGIANWQAAVTIAVRGRELGLTTLQSFASIFIIEGKVTLAGDLIAALVKRSPECASWRLIECSNTKCIIETARRGDPSPTRMEWTIQDAQNAGLTGKDNWKKYPRAMLRARCSAEIARAVYPDVAMGMYDVDEELTPATHTPPRHDELVGEVVGKPAAPPAPVTDDEKCFALAERIDKAATRQEMTAIAADMKAANLAKVLFDALFARWDKKAKEVQAASKTKAPAASAAPPVQDVDPETGEVVSPTGGAS